MTPIKQRNKHDPANGVYGDCHRAALASVLDMPYEDVPHIFDGGCDHDEAWRRQRSFLETVGLRDVSVGFKCDLAAVMRFMREGNPGVYYLLGGTSRTGVNHTVVCLDDAIVHDPSPGDAGIVGPLDDGLYALTFFVTAKTTTRGERQQ